MSLTPAQLAELDQVVASCNTALDGIIENTRGLLETLAPERVMATMATVFQQTDPDRACVALAAAAIRLAQAEVTA